MKIKGFIIDVLVISLITILILEIVLRMIGYRPFYFEPFSIQSSPQACLIPHSKLGLSLEDGIFSVRLNDSLEYTTTHKNNYRISINEQKKDSLKQIQIYGCSFAYGMGEDDDKIFSSFLQEKLIDDYDINNLAVPGYGTIQSLLQLQDRIQQNDIPQKVILAYASFHDQRNVLSPYYREHLYYGFLNMNSKIADLFHQKLDNCQFPYASLDNQELKIQYQKINQIYNPLPLRNKLACMNAFQNFLNYRTHQSLNENQVSINIIEKMNQLCQENQIDFVVFSIVKDDVTSQTLEQLRKKGVQTLDIGLDILNNNDFNHQPIDSHPNEKAHRIYAERLFQYLNPYPLH